MEHMLVVGPIGKRHNYTTFYRNRSNEISVSYERFTGKIDDFLNEIKEKYKGDKCAKVYISAAELAREQIDLKTGAQC